MGARISNYPVGLLSMLDVKTDGRAPSDLLDTYQAVIDVTDLFLLNRVETLVIAPAAAVINSSTFFAAAVVPQNEMWRVWGYDVQTAAMAAGQAWRGAPQMLVQLGGAIVLAQARGATGGAPTESVVVPADREFWLRPGNQLGFFTETLTGAVNVSARVLFSRLRI